VENTETNKHFLKFDGNGTELLKIYLSNLLLIIVTFGIYYFWAKVQVTRYMYRHTQFFENRFDYHATGKERFLGFLKGIALLSVILAAFGAIGYLIYLKTGSMEIITTFMPLMFYLLLFILSPLLLVGRERFRLSRSSWSNVRFRFDGKIKDAYLLFLKGAFLTAVTCGIYFAWFYIDIKKFIIENSKIGNQPFKFRADPGRLLVYFILGYISLIVMFMVTAVIFTVLFKFFDSTFLIIPVGVVFFILITFAASFWQALLERFYWAATSFQEIKFESHLTGFKIFKVAILTTFLVVFTLGIGFPWAIVLNTKLILENLSLNGEPDTGAIIAMRDKNASAVYDGISEAGDVIDSISDVFGM